MRLVGWHLRPWHAMHWLNSCGSVARLSGLIVGWVVVSATLPPLLILGVTTQIVEIYLEVDDNVYIPRFA